MTEWYVKTKDDLGEAVGEILAHDKPFTLELHDKRSRSLEQNALLHRWARDVSKRTGYTVDEVKSIWKGKFAIPLLLREDPDKWIPQFSRIQWNEGTQEEKLRLWSFLPITSVMTVEQMSKLMDLIWQYHVVERGEWLTDPERMKINA